jgi:hypothetical protein
MSVLTPVARLACIVPPPFHMSEWRIRNETAVSYMLDPTYAAHRTRGLLIAIVACTLACVFILLDVVGIRPIRGSHAWSVYVVPLFIPLLVYTSIDLVRTKNSYRRIDFSIPPDSTQLGIRVNGRVLRDPAIMVTPVSITHPAGRQSFQGHAAVVMSRDRKPIILSCDRDVSSVNRDLTAMGLQPFTTHRHSPVFRLRGICAS